MNEIGELLIELRKKKGINQDELATYLGISRPTISDYERGKTMPDLPTMLALARYYGVSLDNVFSNLIFEKGMWKKSTKGNKYGNLKGNLSTLNDDSPNYSRMPKVVTVDSTGADNIIFVPIRARAGYLAGYEDPEFIQTLPTYKLPGLSHGTFRVFEMYGHSMVPTFFESDRLVGRYVENFNEIRDNRVYVVVTKREGIVAKRLVNRISREGKLILNSDNQRHPGEYPPIILDPEEVLEIWYGVMYLSRQMREPGEIYNRLIDVESRLTLLEQRQLKSGE